MYFAVRLICRVFLILCVVCLWLAVMLLTCPGGSVHQLSTRDEMPHSGRMQMDRLSALQPGNITGQHSIFSSCHVLRGKLLKRHSSPGPIDASGSAMRSVGSRCLT